MAIKDILSEFGIKSVGDGTLQGNEKAFRPIKSQSQIDKKLSQNMDDGGRSKLKKYQEDQEVKKMSKIAQDDANIVDKKDNKIALASKKDKNSDISQGSTTAKQSLKSIKDISQGSTTAKNSIKKDIPLPVSAKNKNRKTDSDKKSKAKVVTPAMIKAKGFTTLRDYLNDEKGLKRRDGKKVVRTSTSSSMPKPPPKAPRGKNKIVPSLKQSSTGTDEAKGDNKKEKKTGFVDSIKSGVSKMIDDTKKNFEGDFKKKTGRYKLVSKGTTNFRKGGAVRKKSIMLKGRGGSFKGIR